MKLATFVSGSRSVFSSPTMKECKQNMFNSFKDIKQMIYITHNAATILHQIKNAFNKRLKRKPADFYISTLNGRSSR